MTGQHITLEGNSVTVEHEIVPNYVEATDYELEATTLNDLDEFKWALNHFDGEA